MERVPRARAVRGGVGERLDDLQLPRSQLLVSVSSVGWVPPLGFAALLCLVQGRPGASTTWVQIALRAAGYPPTYGPHHAE